MNFCVIGAGAWGTGVAIHLANCGHSTTLVPRRYEHALKLASIRSNYDYLPNVQFPSDLQIGTNLKPSLMECDFAFVACPSHALRKTCEMAFAEIKSSYNLKGVIALCKGLEPGTNFFAHEVIKEATNDQLAAGYLTGPSHAHDIAVGKPSALSLAIDLPDIALERLRDQVGSNRMRVYSSKDLVGVGLGSCIKNVYAIATGISDGLGLGDNARAALLTRSMNEMISLGIKLGGRKETFFGLSGFGDLIGTCMGEWSRNRNFGLKVANGENPDNIQNSQITVVEGFSATKCFHEKCSILKVEMPILNEIFKILYRGKEPSEALEDLLSRELKSEL